MKHVWSVIFGMLVVCLLGAFWYFKTAQTEIESQKKVIESQNTKIIQQESEIAVLESSIAAFEQAQISKQAQVEQLVAQSKVKAKKLEPIQQIQAQAGSCENSMEEFKKAYKLLQAYVQNN